VFHILSDPSGKSALWVVQRVPDGHVAVIANMFTIREIDLGDSANFLGSSNLLDTARTYGLWDGKGALDFTRAFSLGEYASKYYSGRCTERTSTLCSPASAHFWPPLTSLPYCL